MSDTTHTTHEMELHLLTAQDGTAYLLPRAVVEAGRLTPEEAAAFDEAERSDDVQGLSKTIMAPKIGRIPKPGIVAGFATGVQMPVFGEVPASAEPIVMQKQSQHTSVLETLFGNPFGL